MVPDFVKEFVQMVHQLFKVQVEVQKSLVTMSVFHQSLTPEQRYALSLLFPVVASPLSGPLKAAVTLAEAIEAPVEPPELPAPEPEPAPEVP